MKLSMFGCGWLLIECALDSTYAQGISSMSTCYMYMQIVYQPHIIIIPHISEFSVLPFESNLNFKACQ